MGTIFHVDIVSAEESIYSGPAEFLVAPAQMGEVGIYPRHTPMLTRHSIRHCPYQGTVEG